MSDHFYYYHTYIFYYELFREYDEVRETRDPEGLTEAKVRGKALHDRIVFRSQGCQEDLSCRAPPG